MRAWVGLLLVSSIAMGQPRSGPEFRVNTYTSSNQIAPGVSVHPATGEAVVFWKGPESPIPCKAQRFNAAGARIGGEFYTPLHCTNGLSAAMLPGGLVSIGTEGNLVWGRRVFTSSSSVTFHDFVVNTVTSGTTLEPRVASDANGNFVVVWTAPDGQGNGIFARRFLYSGEPVLSAPESKVNLATAGDQRGAAIARTPAGEFVIVWQSNAGPLASIYGRLLDTSGVPVGPEFRVDDLGTGNYLPDVATDTAGNFVVAWHSYFYNGDYNYNVYGRRFASNGTPLGTSFHVNTSTLGQAALARVARSDLGFVIVWHEAQGDGAGLAAMGRRYSSDGSPVSGVFRVSTYTTGDQSVPAAAARPGGPFLVVWSSANGAPSADIYAQRFCLGGDVDGNGTRTVADVLYLINFLFAGGPPPRGCADASGNTAIDVIDLLYLINFLFAGGPAPV